MVGVDEWSRLCKCAGLEILYFGNVESGAPVSASSERPPAALSCGRGPAHPRGSGRQGERRGGCRPLHLTPRLWRDRPPRREYTWSARGRWVSCSRRCSSRWTASRCTSTRSAASTRERGWSSSHRTSWRTQSRATAPIHRRRQRRGHLRSTRARPGARVQTVDSLGPEHSSEELGARVLPAQRHRAVHQRSDRCARAERGGAHRGRRDGGGRGGDARAGRRPDRLHGQQFPAPRSPGSRLRRRG